MESPEHIIHLNTFGEYDIPFKTFRCKRYAVYANTLRLLIGIVKLFFMGCFVYGFYTLVVLPYSGILIQITRHWYYAVPIALAGLILVAFLFSIYQRLSSHIDASIYKQCVSTAINDFIHDHYKPYIDKEIDECKKETLWNAYYDDYSKCKERLGTMDVRKCMSKKDAVRTALNIIESTIGTKEYDKQLEHYSKYGLELRNDELYISAFWKALLSISNLPY